MVPKNVRVAFMLSSMFLYIVALTQESYCTQEKCIASFAALLVGWMGMYSFGAALSWLANPALWLSWMYMKRKPKRSILFAVISAVFAFLFLFFDEVVINEKGNMGRIISYQAGYWLWAT